MNRFVKSVLITTFLIIVFSVSTISAKNIAPRISFTDSETNISGVQAAADGIELVSSLLIDQIQEVHDKGFWFDATYMRW